MKVKDIFDLDLLLKKAMEYCNANGLDYNKLTKQFLAEGSNVAFFGVPPETNIKSPVGLEHDRETQCLLTLVAYIEEDIIRFEQTEHTIKYLT